jgi:hypothetical protein
MKKTMKDYPNTYAILVKRHGGKNLYLSFSLYLG